MGEDNVKYHFAISLHSAIDRKRSSMIPANLKFPLPEISAALCDFHKMTSKRITIEYILFDGWNDSLQDAAALATFCKAFPVKINLIPYNPVKDLPYRSVRPEKLNAFKEFLEKRNMIVNIRKSRGTDIDAACGQLAASSLPQND